MGGGHQVQPVPPPPMEWPAFPEIPDFSFEMPAMPAFPTFDPNAAAVKQKEEQMQADLRALELKRKGYAGTLLTSGQGDTTPATVKRPGLIGT